MDILDPLSPLIPIVHRLWQVFRATSRILTQLLYVCSSWSSCFCSAICGVHRSTSLMSSSLLLQQFPAWLVRLAWIVFLMEAGGRIVGVLWGVASRTCSILLAVFLCNCRLASPAVLVVSKLCIYIAVSIRPLPRRNCVSFYRSGLTSIW